MREILFKGKRKDNGEWVEGDLLHNDNTNYPMTLIGSLILSRNKYTDEICIDGYGLIEVDPETVCQYTGLKDKNGKKIWEGDIVRFEGYGYMPEVEIGEVVFSRGCFGVEYLSKLYKALGHNDKSFHRIGKTSKWRDMGASGIITYTYEVLGNIFDNPELLGVTE